MSSTLNVPPRRTAAVNVITNPAASLPSSKMAARDRAQSWRGKYLRALNICSDDIEAARRNAEKTAHDGKVRVRAMSFHRSDFADHVAFSRSYSSSTEKEDEERKSLERSSRSNQRREARPRRVPLRAPSTDVGSATLPMMSNTTNPYGFPIRPSMARGRRCHTDPFMQEERVSAPIQIPSAMGVTSQMDGNMRHDPFTRRRASPQSIQGEADVATNNHSATNVRLLSWEEPVAMLAAADAVSKGWRMPHASAMSSLELGVRRSRDEDDEPGLHHMDDEDDDRDGDIFEMDECEEDNNQKETKSRRRYRTESMNTVTSGREKRTHHAYDEFGTNDLSLSFVPPHELVNRSDCFSIGLRDELKKRRPAHHQAHI